MKRTAPLTAAVGLLLSMAGIGGVVTVPTESQVVAPATGRLQPGPLQLAPGLEKLVSLFTPGGSFRGPKRHPGYSGWTNARYCRAAAKRRNVQRNRRAHRG